MGMIDYNQAVYDYVEQYPQLSSWLYFNTINLAPYNASMITGTDTLIREFIDGSQQRQYVCQIAFMREYDTGTSDVNMIAMDEAQNFNRWIEEQNDKGIYPIFDENDNIEKIEGTTQIPEMSVDPDSSIARYTMSIRILYRKEVD